MSYKQTVGPEQDQQERINYMSAEDKEAQEDELLALASIYAEDEFQRAVYAQGGQIRICLELPPNFRIFVNGMGDENHQKGTTEVCVLPPVLLTFELPENYPSTSAPAFVLSCKWLTPVQVKELVGEQLFSRYDRLLLQSSLDSMSDVVYCPRQNCRTPVMKEPGGTMGICSNCRYAFCALCEMTYHGVSPCKPPEDLQELEANGSNGTTENSNEAETLEEEYLEYASIESHKHRSYKTWMEKASRQYVKMNSKKCPHCGIPIEKDGGCNRMYCAKCLKFFCWHCCYALSIGDLRNHSRDSPSCSTR